MADYKFIAFVFVAMAFGLDVVGIANFYDTSGSKIDSVEWSEIGGFVCLTVAVLLFLLIKYSDLSNNKPASICTVVFVLAGGALILLGLILYKDRYNSYPYPYPSALLVVAAACAGLSGLFLLLDVCNCKC